MYPATIVNWHDNSEIKNTQTTKSVDNKALFAVVSSFDKGPEDLMEVEGEEFNELFGTMSFDKHGQNAIQAQRIIDAGGRLLVKRVCADDAKLSNLVLTANVIVTEEQRLDENGDPIFVDENGDPIHVENTGDQTGTTDSTGDQTKSGDNTGEQTGTTDSTDDQTGNTDTTGDQTGSTDNTGDQGTTNTTGTPLMDKFVSIKWTASSISDCTTLEEVKEKALATMDEAAGIYPIFVIADNGRGVSSKAFKLIPDYNTSKGLGRMFYTGAIYEGTTPIEQKTISLDPTIVYSNIAYGLTHDTFEQINGEVLEVPFEKYYAAISNDLDLDPEVARYYDLIFGYTPNGKSIDRLSINKESVDINSEFGIELKGGDNGAFGDKPVGTDAWAEAMRKVWAGEVTDEVWDIDQHKIAAVLDANLPQTVKDAIADFVNFRKDCVFFRDFGVGNNSFSMIYAQWVSQLKRSYFISDMGTSYQIKDPLTKKNIEVTMNYDFAACLVNHMNSGPYNPLAGTVNSFTLDNAIKGTINYTPIVTPKVNQKQAMEEIRVNYAIFEEDTCVIQTSFTSQEPYTQLSYTNNVMAIQEVVRAVRTACPKSRYSLSTGTSADLSEYARAVNKVLQNFASNFSTLEFEYTQDKLKASQKIFYASIKFAFRNWAQTEIFDIYAIND